LTNPLAAARTKNEICLRTGQLLAQLARLAGKNKEKSREGAGKGIEWKDVLAKRSFWWEKGVKCGSIRTTCCCGTKSWALITK